MENAQNEIPGGQESSYVCVRLESVRNQGNCWTGLMYREREVFCGGGGGDFWHWAPPHTHTHTASRERVSTPVTKIYNLDPNPILSFYENFLQQFILILN